MMNRIKLSSKRSQRNRFQLKKKAKPLSGWVYLDLTNIYMRR